MADSVKSMAGRLGAFALHATHDSTEITKNARANSPGSLAWHERQVDPNGELDPAERARRAEFSKKLYFGRLAMASARARRKAAK